MRLSIVGFASPVNHTLARPTATLEKTPVSGQARVRFGGGLESDSTMAALERRISVSGEDNLNPQFVKNVRAGARQMLEGFSPEFRQALLAHGWRVHIVPTASEAMLALQNFAPDEPLHPEREKQVENQLRDLRVNPRSKNSFWQNVDDFRKKYPGILTTKKSSELSAQELKALVRTVERLKLVERQENHGPNYSQVSQCIVMPQQGRGQDWTSSPEFLARTLRHETFHFLDATVAQRFGQDFSQSEEFKEAVIEDKQTAEVNKAWPNPEERVREDSPMDGARLGHYFHPNPEREKQDDYGDPFAEPFAEIGAALTGGGAIMPPERVLDVYPQTAELIRREVLEKYNMGQTLNRFA